mmetsp:Transcript_117391/g.204424  ORF Transcript_117391/g.204424 Transcript_117391/m.204424 type:complete len:528 (-) Transcript_117391:449-2032(-)
MPAKRKASEGKRKIKSQKRTREQCVEEEDMEEEYLDSEEELVFEDPDTDVEYDSEEEEAERQARRERRAKRLEEEEAMMEQQATSSASNRPIFLRPKEGEKLILDRRAYDMRHVLNVEWPCMSFDILVDTQGFNRTKYPLACMIVTGSQAENPRDCQVIMKKINHMCRTRHDKDDDDSSSDEDDDEEDLLSEEEDDGEEDDDEDPVIFTKECSHHGAVQRVRAMQQQPGIVACWGEDGNVRAYDLRDYYKQLADPKGFIMDQAKDPKAAAAKQAKKKHFFETTQAQHACDGFALQWSPKVEGLLASGDCNGKINVFKRDSTGTSYVATPLTGHTESVEDLQWSPQQENVLASCGVDGTVRLWDIRDTNAPEKLKWQADVVDINVISWNTCNDARQFMATGSDSGVFKLWDLRMVKRADPTPISEFSFHQSPITSIEWSAINSSLIAVASGDMVTLWDLSVERDEEEQDDQPCQPEDDKVPPQLMFVHQGVEEAKEIHWHPQLPGMLIVTDLNGFQFFKPVNWKSLIK